MSDVPIKYLDRLESRVRKTLRGIVKQGFDMKRIHAIIDRDERMVSRVFVNVHAPF
jgi:hypothetical protein